DNGIEDKILQFSGGLGCDGIIITAASNSLDSINFAGALSLKRGTIVVLGDVPTGFDREPHFYKKELQVKMSCSYGPGRYDLNFEEKGIDYPAAYVRWTENRNMQAFQDLMYSRKIDLRYLTTHILKLEDAPIAYDMMIKKSQTFIGILIEYNRIKPIDYCSISTKKNIGTIAKVDIAFIDAGSYAQSFLLPNIPKGNKNISFKGVMTSTSASSRSVADRFGFEFCTCN
ncbi:MAG: oxidoreductase, partial [bacterium]